MRWNKLSTIAWAAGTCLAATALAVDNPETEPNDSKFAANTADSGGTGMAPGDTITGTTTGTSTTVAGPTSSDNFLVRTVAAPLAIYRYRLQLTSDTLGQAGTLRGLTQTAGSINAGTDAIAQTSSTSTTLAVPPRTVQWYGFGRSEQIYYRVTGVASSSAAYTSTLSRDEVAPIDVSGTIIPGDIVITTHGQGHTTDTDLWLYDADLNAIPDAGNDDESILGGGPGTTLQSRLSRNLAPGTYYLALSNFAFANNQPSPFDDDFRTGFVLDFPDAAVSSSTGQNNNVSFSIISSAGTIPVAATRTDAFQVMWFRFVIENPNFPYGPATANPNPVVEGQSTTLTVAVTPASDGQATSHTVVADATSIGGGSVSLLDDGVAPDQVAGDNIFTATVQANAAAGAYQLPVTISDNLGRSSNSTANITASNSPSGACCAATACSVTRQFLCETAGNAYQGAGTNCGGGYAYTLGGGSDFEDISATGTVISGTPGDDAIFTVNLAFSFNFFGTMHTQVGINTNGYLQFPPLSTATGTWQNVPIPNTALPNNILAVLWDDFNFNVNSNDNLQHEVRGTSGVDLRHIFQWTNVGQFGTTANTDFNTFQCVLFEDGHVEFRYSTTLSDSSFEGIAGFPGCTIGVEDSTGDAALSSQYGTGDGVVTPGSNIRVDAVVNNPCDTAPPCRADFNNDTFVNPDDLADFITCFFLDIQFPGFCPAADFNGDTSRDPDDLADFITTFFLAVQFGC